MDDAGRIGYVPPTCSGHRSAEMEEQVGRTRVAVAYTWLLGIATAEVVLQGFLFSGFYAQIESAFLEAHGIAGPKMKMPGFPRSFSPPPRCRDVLQRGFPSCLGQGDAARDARTHPGGGMVASAPGSC